MEEKGKSCSRISDDSRTEGVRCNNAQDFTVLDMHTGQRLCEAPLPQTLDRAALTVSGGTGVLVFSDGMIKAAPVRDWMKCLVDFPR